MAKDDMAARHKALIDECNSPNPAVTGPDHSRSPQMIDSDRQTRLLAAILEKLHAA
jgi:hypothetical protein